MTIFGAQPLARGGSNGARFGADRLELRAVGHELLADGDVRLVLPRDGRLTDAEARRLAWGLLADLAPDDTVPTPPVVTYLEAQRLAVLRAVADGACDCRAVADRLGWTIRCAQRRCHELIEDGRLTHVGVRRRGVHLTFELTKRGE